jgi:hypothetical protein
VLGLLLLAHVREELPDLLLPGGDLADLLDHRAEIGTAALAFALVLTLALRLTFAALTHRAHACAPIGSGSAAPSCLACCSRSALALTATIASAACCMARSPLPRP